MRGLIGYVESLKIHSAVETLDRFRQLSVHFFDHLLVRIILAAIISTCQIKSRGRSPTTRDIVTRYFVHYSKHSWDEVLQDFCLLGDDSFATCFTKGKIRTQSQRPKGT